MVKQLRPKIAVIGGGIVGIALARALARGGHGDVTVFETEDGLAAHQTGHNSGVVHAGMYYKPGTLKADLCGQGRKLMKEFCNVKGIPYRAVGKLVVAVDESELAALADIENRAMANGVPDLRRLDSATELRRIEPHAAGIAAIYSPLTASVDYAQITEAMAEDLRIAGGHLLVKTKVVGISQDGRKARVLAGNREFSFDRVIACAGLDSDLVAKLVGADSSPKILPFRGEYWNLDPRRNHLVRGMIYPVPDPRFPFLGVHFTRGVDDHVHVGPNAVPALSRHGYRWRDISLKDTWNSLTWPGAPKLARDHWRMGVGEVAGSILKPIFFRRAKKYIPELEMKDLVSRSAAGVRAQAWGRDGSLLDDFAVEYVGCVTLLRNAPSPAATSSLAIAAYIIENYLDLR